VHHDLHDAMPVEALPNLSEAIAGWLHAVGLHTWGDISAIGAVDAYLRVEAQGLRPSLNLLYALEGALLGEHWLQVKRDRKLAVLTALQAAREMVQA